eukprot:jgi/Picsp_1/5557/NSC_02916-R1_---NA---
MPMPYFDNANDMKAMYGRSGDFDEALEGFVNFSVLIDSSNVSMRDEAVEIYSGAVLICKLLHCCNVEVSCDLIYCKGSPSADAIEGEENLLTEENNKSSHYLNSRELLVKKKYHSTVAECRLRNHANSDVDDTLMFRVAVMLEQARDAGVQNIEFISEGDGQVAYGFGRASAKGSQGIPLKETGQALCCLVAAPSTHCLCRQDQDRHGASLKVISSHSSLIMDTMTKALRYCRWRLHGFKFKSVRSRQHSPQGCTVTIQGESLTILSIFMHIRIPDGKVTHGISFDMPQLIKDCINSALVDLDSTGKLEAPPPSEYEHGSSSNSIQTLADALYGILSRSQDEELVRYATNTLSLGHSEDTILKSLHKLLLTEP